MLAQFRRKFLRDVSAELLSVASRTSGQPTSVDRLGRSPIPKTCRCFRGMLRLL
jgi:hypothetical protein